MDIPNRSITTGETGTVPISPLVSLSVEEALPSAQASESTGATSRQTRAPRRIIRRNRALTTNGTSSSNDTTSPVLVDPVVLQRLIQESALPDAYTFELEKTIARIIQINASHVCLQLPEGLLLYATVLADLLRRMAPCLRHVSILGDVTYGACCVDDLGAKALGAQLLVHYGHSCLVPLQHTVIPCLYIFVEIQIDISHLVECLHATLLTAPQAPMNTVSTTSTPSFRIFLLGTIQFRHALFEIKRLLQEEYQYSDVQIPQVKPLSPGEVLGCTSPSLIVEEGQTPIVCFVADGRFHLESTLISNPHIVHNYRYDPYGKVLTREAYQHTQMRTVRFEAIEQARTAKSFGILLGTLGRQGNPAIAQRIQRLLRKHGRKSFLCLISEITPTKLACFHTHTINDNNIEAWVQVACPRLSVDWGHALSPTKDDTSASSSIPVLTPYELMVCLGETEWKDHYPMDYYAQTGGPWTNYYPEHNQGRMYNTRTGDSITTTTTNSSRSQCCGEKPQCPHNATTALQRRVDQQLLFHYSRNNSIRGRRTKGTWTIAQRDDIGIDKRSYCSVKQATYDLLSSLNACLCQFTNHNAQESHLASFRCVETYVSRCLPKLR